MKVGGHASCSKIQETAREVYGRCHGLPLALNVLGETHVLQEEGARME